MKLRKVRVADIVKFILMTIFILGIFGYSIVNLTHNQNIRFDSQELFIDGGYLAVYDNSKNMLDEYNQYLTDNSERYLTYGLDINNVIEVGHFASSDVILSEISDGESKVSDIIEYDKDVLIALRSIFLNLNIKAYEFITGKDILDAEESIELREIESKLYKTELIYDGFVNNLDTDDVYIKSTPTIISTSKSMNEWFKRDKRVKIDKVLMVYSVVAMILILYRYIWCKDSTHLIIFSLSMILAIFLYRAIEENYNPVYIQINDMFGVNLDTNNDYFVTYAPVVAIEEFVNEGGDIAEIEGDGYTRNVNWSRASDVQEWKESPYAGDSEESNIEALNTIRDRYI